MHERSHKCQWNNKEAGQAQGDPEGDETEEVVQRRGDVMPVYVYFLLLVIAIYALVSVVHHWSLVVIGQGNLSFAAIELLQFHLKRVTPRSNADVYRSGTDHVSQFGIWT